MVDNPQSSTMKFCRRFAVLAGAGAATTSALVLTGWWLGIPALTSIRPGLASMKPMSAICFALIGGALLLMTRIPSGATSPWGERVISLCALLTAMIGALNFVEALLHVNLGIDRLLFSAAVGAEGGLSPGRMSAATAVAFVFMGVGLLLRSWETHERKMPGQIFTLAALLIGYIALVGYAYNPRDLYAMVVFSSMALPTASLFVITAIATLLAFPSRGLMTVVNSGHLGGWIAWRLLPVVVVVPVLLGWLRLKGENLGLFQSEFGIALFVTLNVAVSGLAVWIGAIELNRIDSKRKQVEDRNFLLAAIVDSSNDAIIVITLEGIITSWNHGAERIYGYREDEVVGRPATILAPADRAAEIPAFVEKIRQGASVSHFETVRRRKDGSLIDVSLAISPVRNQQGLIIGASAAARDVTEQKKTASLVREQAGALDLATTQLLSALEAGRMGTWIWEIAGNSLFCDDLCTRLLGREPADAALKSLEPSFAVVHPEDQARVRSALEHSLHDDHVYDVEFRIVRPDASVVWMESRGRLERDPEGRPVRMVGVLMDINTRKQMEEYVLQSQKMQALGTLAGGIAHDFNNILMAIGGNAQLAMQQAATDDPVQRSLNNISKATSRATSLVKQILTFSRQQEVQHKVIDLRAVIEEALTLLRSSLSARIVIRSNFSNAIPKVLADSTQIHQIIMNLGANAARAIGENQGVLEVLLDAVNIDEDFARTLSRLKPGPHVRVVVSDDGCGMEPAVLKRVFDPFFTTCAPGQGTGLGLSVVHGIMKGHDGAVSVSSEPGKGTAFYLYFPAVKQAELQPEVTAQAPPRPPLGNGEHILYVDDEKPLVSLVSRSLKRLGYEVFGYSDAATALEAFREHPDWFDAVISDLSMPGLSGWELCQEIHAIRAATPIVLTSGYVKAEDQEMAKRIGVIDLVAKPDTVDDLAHALQRALDRAHEASNGHQLTNGSGAASHPTTSPRV
jgi:PAS domain S-box-containing protein